MNGLLLTVIALFSTALDESHASDIVNNVDGGFITSKRHPHRRHGEARRTFEDDKFTSTRHSSETPLWFDQVLDHFQNEPQRFVQPMSWRQRYWVNDQYFKSQADGTQIAFLMIGGEGRANAKWMDQGTWISYAKRLGAICFMLEHRYYGDSRPTEDASTANMRYLSSEQALADLANFVTVMNKKHGLDQVKWVAFGGSYPGSLAAWIRLKYPDLITASVSTSGPLKAKVNFFEYLEVVEDVLDKTDKRCRPSLTKALKKVYYLTKHRIGWKVITNEFRLCNPINGSNPLDVAVLFETLVGNFEDIVQYNNDNRLPASLTLRQHRFGPGVERNIETLCKMMTSGDDPFEQLVAVNNFILGDEQTCVDVKYSDEINSMRSTSWTSEAVASGGRSWFYQTCTEFGWYQSSDQPDHAFLNMFPIETWVKQCADTFGEVFQPETVEAAAQKTNKIYGSTDLRTTNVIFVHGSFDPWHMMGLFKTNNSTSMPVIYIEGTAHCANMYPESEYDPPNLKEAREEIFGYLTKWLAS